jgi:hypothetical protein
VHELLDSAVRTLLDRLFAGVGGAADDEGFLAPSPGVVAYPGGGFNTPNPRHENVHEDHVELGLSFGRVSTWGFCLRFETAFFRQFRHVEIVFEYIVDKLRQIPDLANLYSNFLTAVPPVGLGTAVHSTEYRFVALDVPLLRQVVWMGFHQKSALFLCQPSYSWFQTVGAADRLQLTVVAHCPHFFIE